MADGGPDINAIMRQHAASQQQDSSGKATDLNTFLNNGVGALIGGLLSKFTGAMGMGINFNSMGSTPLMRDTQGLAAAPINKGAQGFSSRGGKLAEALSLVAKDSTLQNHLSGIGPLQWQSMSESALFTSAMTPLATPMGQSTGLGASIA